MGFFNIKWCFVLETILHILTWSNTIVLTYYSFFFLVYILFYLSHKKITNLTFLLNAAATLKEFKLVFILFVLLLQQPFLKSDFNFPTNKLLTLFEGFSSCFRSFVPVQRSIHFSTRSFFTTFTHSIHSFTLLWCGFFGYLQTQSYFSSNYILLCNFWKQCTEQNRILAITGTVFVGFSPKIGCQMLLFGIIVFVSVVDNIRNAWMVALISFLFDIIQRILELMVSALFYFKFIKLLLAFLLLLFFVFGFWLWLDSLVKIGSNCRN